MCGILVLSGNKQPFHHRQLGGLRKRGRLESHGEPNVPQVSELTADLLRSHFEVEARGHIDLKNRGVMKVFRLIKPL